ncbi:MFS transporter [Aquincola sp. MAHUQ-54]|uniref:MFS transporter n=1 Tax=Aquincola agrisoli TaxID=3119538 RepID=A0AAW9QCE6_9BURK
MDSTARTTHARQPAAGRDAPLDTKLVVRLGLSQVVGWGTMHYLIAVFAAPMADDLGWSLSFVQAGFSLALVVMALASPAVGRWIDAHGGRGILMAGCLVGAGGCGLLASCVNEATYLGGWVLLGLAMAMSLYDAAFSTLARIAGPSARRAMAAVTLFGGLASTVFWPFGQWLSGAAGWRGALWVYAAILASASLLHRRVPRAPPREPCAIEPRTAMTARAGAGRMDVLLYGIVVVLVVFMQTGVAAHFIEFVRGLGWSPAAAGLVASLLGVGQFTGRAWVVLRGHRHDATILNLIPGALLMLCYVVPLTAGGSLAGMAAFALLYGAGNGIATISRGAMPLVLFDPGQYGRIMGSLMRPALLLAALAPVALAEAIGRVGHRATLGMLLASCVLLLACSIALAVRFHHHTRRQHAT